MKSNPLYMRHLHSKANVYVFTTTYNGFLYLYKAFQFNVISASTILTKLNPIFAPPIKLVRVEWILQTWTFFEKLNLAQDLDVVMIVTKLLTQNKNKIDKFSRRSLLKVSVIGAPTLVLGLRGFYLVLDTQLHCILYLPSYGILCHRGNFSYATS